MKYLPVIVIVLLLALIGVKLPGYLFPAAWIIANILFH
jgi:hypothetical protein